jgi:hypothetical protein
MTADVNESQHPIHDNAVESLLLQWTSEKFVLIRGEPRGLSTTHDGRLIVACGRPGALRIFDGSDGRSTRVIQVAGVEWPNQAIAVAPAASRFRRRQDIDTIGATSVGNLDDDNDGDTEILVVCHGEGGLTTKNELNEVLLIEISASKKVCGDVVGKILRRYEFCARRDGETATQPQRYDAAGCCCCHSLGRLHTPAAFVVVDDRRLVFLVVDVSNNRVIQLDDTLSGVSHNSRILFQAATPAPIAPGRISAFGDNNTCCIRQIPFQTKPQRLNINSQDGILAVAFKKCIHLYSIKAHDRCCR